MERAVSKEEGVCVPSNRTSQTGRVKMSHTDAQARVERSLDRHNEEQCDQIGLNFSTLAKF